MSKLFRIAIAVAMVSATALFGLTSPANAAGATQISGTIVDACDVPPPEGFGDFNYAFRVGGDLDGCVYGVITSSRSHPSGTYQEVADEIFVGSYGDGEGSFKMTEFYTEKSGADNITGLHFARCKHPIVAGSGDGVFEGVSGRLDFKDDTDAGTSAYKGHLRFG